MTKKLMAIATICIANFLASAQTNPAIISWLQNNSITGTFYTSGNSTAQPNNILVNCQKIEYSTNNVYLHTKGVPAYATGPFLDGNPSQAIDQNAIFKFTLNPIQNTGTLKATTVGNIGVFINGVALFDYRDGVAWNNTTLALCGGPGNPPCPGGMGATQAWNRDAIPAEKAGFDCSKAHPAMGNYHHHQNPSAFKLDLNVISTICNLYDADGLYTMDSTKHSPLIGFAYDGFPIYGAYGYKNVDGTGGIVRMKSSYSLSTNTTRVNGPTVGQVVGTQTMFNGYFREDYVYNATTASDYLDEHNGRVCKTPEYPNGIYCYFATVDNKWNSTYPYVVGPTFYGTYTNAKVASVTEATTVYAPTAIANFEIKNIDVNIFPNPTNEFITIQLMGLNKEEMHIELTDITGKLLTATKINAGATNTFIDTKTFYAGTYLVRMYNTSGSLTRKVLVNK
jgi:YHYH protein/Secretion system C-terminal sorting domain